MAEVGKDLKTIQFDPWKSWDFGVMGSWNYENTQVGKGLQDHQV